MKILTLLSVAALVFCAPATSVRADDAPRTITITGNDAMKFDVATINAAPGEKLKIVFKNVGTLPKEAMGHNLIILKKGSDPVAYATAAMADKESGYMPKDKAGDVVAGTKLLGPGESDTIEFTVPADAGEYPYLCSFPAHCMAGMKGVLIVK